MIAKSRDQLKNLTVLGRSQKKLVEESFNNGENILPKIKQAANVTPSLDKLKPKTINVDQKTQFKAVEIQEIKLNETLNEKSTSRKLLRNKLISDPTVIQND